MTKLEKFEEFLRAVYEMSISEFQQMNELQQKSLLAEFKDRYGISLSIYFAF